MKRRQLRVAVATCFRYDDILRAMGAPPVSAMNGREYFRLTEEENARAAEGHWEDMRRLRPELIITDTRHKLFFERFRRLAPTVVLDYTADWRGLYRRLAELVGREQETALLLEQLEEKTARARGLLRPRFGCETVSLMRWLPRRVRVQGLIDHPLNELIYTELGLQPGSHVPTDAGSKEFPLDGIPPMETDHLFIFNAYVQAQDQPSFQRMQRSESWNAIKAVRDQRAVLIPNWIGMSWTPGGRSQIIDELLRAKALL